MSKLVSANRVFSGVRLLQDIVRPRPSNVPELFSPKSVSSVISRSFSLTPTTFVKTITEKQDGNALVIEGVISPSSRVNTLVHSDTDCKACPLCRLNLDVKHTDVLILSQFVRSNGCMLPKRITGLCSVQQKRVGYMVTMAHKAGLMGKLKPKNCTFDPRNRRDWKKWNTYFDETTIKPPKVFLALRYKEKERNYLKAREENSKRIE